jgi:hypothetical protein
MPSPTFTFRLPVKDKEALFQLAALYGSSPGGFVAEMVGVICSGDFERIKAFNARLIANAGEQMTLKLNSAFDASVASKKPAQESVKRSTGRKGASRRAKRA